MELRATPEGSLIRRSNRQHEVFINQHQAILHGTEILHSVDETLENITRVSESVLLEIECQKEKEE
jgi:hypothetical protein